MVEALGAWLVEFTDLHERRKRGLLGEDELDSYRRARAALSELLVIGQRLEFKSSENTRKAVRVARALQVELDLPIGRGSFVTRDLSVGGLCALVDEAPPVGSVVTFRLKLGRELEPVAGRCRVVNASANGGSTRMAVMFEDLDPDSIDRIETIVFDTVVASLRLARLERL